MKKKKKEQRKILWKFVLAVMLTAGVMLICIYGFIFYIGNSIGQALIQMGDMHTPPCNTPDELESFAQISLPESYENLESICGGMQGWYAEAKFDINPDDLEAFLESTLITPDSLSSTEMPDYTHSGYFRPIEEPVTSYLYGSQWDGDWFEEVIVDTSNPERWTVYFTLLAG